MSVLEVNNVSVRYITGDFKDIGIKEYVLRHLTRNYHVREFWADKDVTFSIGKGEMLGIIGANGAGKSTLLKVVAGIMEPTEGSVYREGNIAALLELASGFDGDLTVKENAYLRGAMLGYTRKFMDESYEEIIQFAELKEFEDRPFKQLSSGMKSRLAFSVASMVQPDLLILDEVLSVGDGAFQKKSAEKMQEIIHSGAATILVSHSLKQIRDLCTKILWLDKGKQIAFGDDVNGLCNAYQRFLDGGSIVFHHGNLQVHFKDVADPSKYYYEPIYWAIEKNITSSYGGPGLFSPDRACTLEQCIVFLWRYAGQPEPTSLIEYADMKETDWFCAAVSWALETGIIDPPENNTDTIGIGSSCTREQCILMLHRMVGAPAAVNSREFSDVETGSIYESAILWAAENKITVGKNDGSGRFGVGQPCTRAMIIAFLYRYAHLSEARM